MQPLAATLRRELSTNRVAARGTAFGLASSEDRSYGIAVIGVEPDFEPRVSTVPGLIKDGRYLGGGAAEEVVIGAALARNLKVAIGDELTVEIPFPVLLSVLFPAPLAPGGSSGFTMNSKSPWFTVCPLSARTRVTVNVVPEENNSRPLEL